MSRGDFPPSGGRQFPSNEIPWSSILRGLPLIIVVVLGLVLVFDSYFTVEKNERAVVLWLGKPSRVVGSGLHWKTPLAEQAITVDISDQRLRLPFGDQQGNRQRPISEDLGLMLTAEQNAAVVEWDIQWRVSDPELYLFRINSEDINEVIRAATTSVMHRLIGDYSIDEVLTTERGNIADQAKRDLQKILDSYKAGIRIANLNVQRVTPPESVKAAYDDVISAQQRKQQLINEAQREKNTILPKARADKNEDIKLAEGEKNRRMKEVEGRVEALKAQFEAYKAAPEVTQRRMYLEALEEVMASSGEKVIIDGDLKKAALPLLNLNAGGR